MSVMARTIAGVLDRGEPGVVYTGWGGAEAHLTECQTLSPHLSDGVR